MVMKLGALTPSRSLPVPRVLGIHLHVAKQLHCSSPSQMLCKGRKCLPPKNETLGRTWIKLTDMTLGESGHKESKVHAAISKKFKTRPNLPVMEPSGDWGLLAGGGEKGSEDIFYILSGLRAT